MFLLRSSAERSRSKGIHALGLLGQFGAEFGMGYAYQFPRSLLGGFAAKLGDTVFGDNIVDVVFAGADVRARCQGGHDARDGVILCGGWQNDERLATARTIGGAHKISLTASARIGRASQTFRAALADKINLHGGVDRHQIVVLAGQIGIVGEDIVLGRQGTRLGCECIAN